MARPTIPKLVKMQNDMNKMSERLGVMRATLTDMTINPMGSDAEMVKHIKMARDQVIETQGVLRIANNHLDTPLTTLKRRKDIK